MDLLLLLCVFPVVKSYSSGGVTESCEDMHPHHGTKPQTSPSPFSITTDNTTYTPGQDVTVQLWAPDSTTFSGFLLQAREVGGQSVAVGKYYTITEDVQVLTCSKRPSSAVSHTSDSAKSYIEVTWRPEDSEHVKAVQFHASFVQNYTTFWVDVTSPALSLVKGSDDVSPSPLTTTHASITSAECGVTKTCFSQPPLCDPAVGSDCYFMSAMIQSPSGASIRYEMTGPSQGYISFGFSDDQMMGNDDIYICGLGSDGLVRVQHAFSFGRMAPQVLPQDGISDVKAWTQDGVISCSFTSMNTISTQRTSGFNQTYFILFAHGPSSNDKIEFHTGTFISTDKIDISSPQVVQKAGRPHIIKAHGALMLIAWMTTGTLGMLVARYLKAVATGRTVCSKDVWFVVHVAVMSVTVAATVIAFILSFSYVQGWSEGAHPVLGCLVMILTFLQPIVALLRCGPQHPLRFLFNWSHAFNAVTIKALAVAAIFTGLRLIDSTMDRWLVKVMGGFTGWEALLYVLLEAHSKWKVYTKDTTGISLESKPITADVLLMTVFFLGNLCFLISLLVGISMS
ncbi:putative ferric-chelate reductase 1 [Mugil cephalus]|uniref:putative ferric-chelate reductase 1 n=1 Tax=Mugil cephalus TaxID=48193 RepID=UPI001FB72699|nr:putative ferric-chelate reductase 1 [Mugil cephalus]